MKPADPTILPESLRKLGLVRGIDALLHLPLRYENESLVWPTDQVKGGAFAQIQVRVIAARIVFRPRRMLLVDVEDDTGAAVLRFIHFKDAQKHAFATGAKIRVLGEPRRSLAGLEFIHPRVRSGWLDQAAIGQQPLVAVYPTAAGIAQSTLRRAVDRAMQNDLPEEWLPKALLDSLKLMPLPEALRLLHRPPADAERSGLLATLSQREGSAWNRVRFDELLAQQVALRRARSTKQAKPALALASRHLADQLIKSLAFRLTGAQQQVAAEIGNELARDIPMQRLLQGDVGSGKTVIAALACAQAIGSGVQAAVMAPTEILATQLYDKFQTFFAAMGVPVMLLKSGLPAASRRVILEQAASGAPCMIIGTHALIQKDVVFGRLGLAVVDEQHRFGVGQRLALRGQNAATSPHMLAMSATPIPRSLAMTFLADLDVSSLTEKPAGRVKIATRLMAASRRDELMERLKTFIAQGGQAYWVCPVIDADPDGPAGGHLNHGVARDRERKTLQAIETAREQLTLIFGDQLVVLHGRMSSEEKSAAMAAFAQGRAKLMLATTVIEVGVDVPSATLMVIEHAERFGLAQLHQLRGRIGRGQESSTCILLFDEPLSDTARERLKTLYETDDGFEVARRDLAIRGPGEFLGLRQSGVPSLRYSDIAFHAALIEQAVAFGAKLAQAESSPEQLAAIGVRVQDLDALVDRWAYGKEALLASG